MKTVFRKVKPFKDLKIVFSLFSFSANTPVDQLSPGRTKVIETLFLYQKYRNWILKTSEWSMQENSFLLCKKEYIFIHLFQF